MSKSISRRQILRMLPTVCGAASILGFQRHVLAGDQARPQYDEFPRQDLEAVKEVVTFSHFDLARVKQIVSARPALAKASWDWGFGDWEEAIGAASHVGRRDIAELLIQYGARPTLFTWAMLGYVDIVRATIEASPGIQRQAGAHGITLLAHAQKAGSRAKAVVEYLKKLGDADISQAGVSVPALESKAMQGTYTYGPANQHRIKIYEKKGSLTIKPGEQTPRPLYRSGPWEYHPAGAPAVRIRFDSSSEPVSKLTITDAELNITASRLTN